MGIKHGLPVHTACANTGHTGPLLSTGACYLKLPPQAFPFGPAASGILRSAEFSNLQWDERSQPGCMADILRVHDWSYVRSIQHLCASIPDVPSVVGHLDADTAISHGTFRAAQVAVGGICRAVDQVVSGQVRARPFLWNSISRQEALSDPAS